MTETVQADPMDEPGTFIQQAIWAIFTGEPREQMVYSFLALMAAWLSTAVTWGATIFLVVIFSITFLIGLGRLAYRAIR